MPTSPVPGVDLERDDPNEFILVERPLLAQLVAMGWDFIQGDLDYAGKTGRTSFRETVLLERLRSALRRINKDDHGQEWLDDLTLDRAVRELLRPEGHGLLEQNRTFSRRLVSGVRVPVAEGPRAGEEVTLHVVAWVPDRLHEHGFLAINQFLVLINGTTSTKRPGVVLFVNGLPEREPDPSTVRNEPDILEALRRRSAQLPLAGDSAPPGTGDVSGAARALPPVGAQPQRPVLVPGPPGGP